MSVISAATFLSTCEQVALLCANLCLITRINRCLISNGLAVARAANLAILTCDWFDIIYLTNLYSGHQHSS